MSSTHVIGDWRLAAVMLGLWAAAIGIIAWRQWHG
jgi:hypothetical protein